MGSLPSKHTPPKYEVLNSEKSSEHFRSSSSDSGSQSLLQLDEVLGPQWRYPRQSSRRAQFAAILHWLAHALCLITIAALAMVVLRRVHGVDPAKCWDFYNYYSPVNDAVVPHPYVHRQFNGSLWYESPFKGPPTPEVERAWYDVMKFGLIRVTRDDIEKIHHPDWSAQFPPEAGGGYIAATIGSHQIHCLHYVWQDHYIEQVPAMQDRKRRVPEMYERHYEHCVDYIRQSLMCQFDTGIIPYNWVLDHTNPTPNANTHHKCVDWERLQGWLENRRVEIPDGFVWSQPEDAISLDYNP